MNDTWNKIKSKLVDLKGLASIGFADIVGSGLTAFFWFYLATVIEPKAYGEIHYYLSIAGIASYIALVGTSNVMTVYVAKNVKIQATLSFISLVIGVIASFAIIILFYRIDAGVMVIGYIINTLAIGELLGKKFYSNYAKHTLIQKGLTLGLGISFYHMFGAEGVIFALASSYVFYSTRIYRIFKETVIDFTLVRERFGFIVNNYILILLGGVVGQVSKVIVAPLLGFAILGNYALALQLFGAMMIFSTIVFKFVLPEDSSGKTNKNLKKGTVLISICITVLGITLLPHIIPIIFPKFNDAIESIQIMSIAIVPATIYMIYTSKFLAVEKSKFILISTLISLVITIGGMLVLGMWLGIIGIAISFVLATSAETAYMVIMDRMRVKNSA